MEIIAFQEEFRPDLPNVYGTQDYRTFRNILIKVDNILIRSGLEHDLILEAMKAVDAKNPTHLSKPGKAKNLTYRYKILKHALRCNIPIAFHF